ncbi:unnamed protein product [Plutella xylostella]|uniref:(diamondback moth) hypothetical protein n=1 Tax=Plutella xylostella TaxID=51655 RepID=A0A8S4FVZ3_PLUXY|nr:unnamed protein product [Plutella xylostella]
MHVCRWDVAAVCQGADAAALAARAQVCVLVTSLAALEAAREARPGLPQRARAAAGFSLGEVTALVFAGAIDLEPALRFVELRQAALAAAGAGRGGLATLWLAPAADLRALLRDAAAHAAEQGDDEPFAEVANYLYPGCKVVAGSEAALRWLEARGAGRGVRRAARVAAAGPLHCRAVRRAAPPLREALRMMEVRDPRITVVSNVDAKPYRDAKHIVRQLPLQACSPVRWEQTLHALFARPRGGGAGGGGSRRCWRWARAARSEPRSSRSTPRPGTTACRSTSDTPASPHCKYYKATRLVTLLN